MDKNSGEFILQIRDTKTGRFVRNIKVNGIIENQNKMMQIISGIEYRLNHIDFKLMNSFKSSINLCLMGLIDYIHDKENNQKYKNNNLDKLYMELTKLIDAIISDLSFTQLDLYKVRTEVIDIAQIYYFARQIDNDNVLSNRQYRMIEERFFILFDLFNKRIKNQIDNYHNDNAYFASLQTNSFLSYFTYYFFIDSTDYRIKELEKISFELNDLKKIESK